MLKTIRHTQYEILNSDVEAKTVECLHFEQGCFLVSASVSVSVSVLHSLVSVLALVSLCSGLINKPGFEYLFSAKSRSVVRWEWEGIGINFW